MLYLVVFLVIYMIINKKLFQFIKNECKKLNLTSFDFRICVELPIKAKRLGFDYECKASFERSRIGGKKKVNAIKDGLLILLEMIKLFFVK